MDFLFKFHSKTTTRTEAIKVLAQKSLIPHT